MAASFHLQYDVIIIGSGFGGSVAAMRLSQKGYRVVVLESGKRFAPEDFAKTNWQLRKYLWAPLLRCFGIQKISLFKGLMLLHGVGVGGGSLVYANTLMRPEAKIFDGPLWPGSCAWNTELDRHFEEARKMLGVARVRELGPADLALQNVAEKMNVKHTFHPTEVGVYFGKSNELVGDPYFSGEGPPRAGCNQCGGCIVGCRYRAKNTLDYNYLYFAEKWGATVVPETAADRIIPVKQELSTYYRVETKRTTTWLPSKGPTFEAKKVIVSAGVLGTLKLLLKNRDVYKTLPGLSQNLGKSVRTNGESLLGATSFKKNINYSYGVAIGSAIHPDANTKIEAVRYPSGSDFMRILAVPLTEDGNLITRPLKMVARLLFRIPQWCRLVFLKDWARSTIILLVMQSVDLTMNLTLKKGLLRRFGLLTAEKGTSRVPSYLPVAQRAAEHLADVIDGEPQNVISEVLLKTPATAHILGGCCLGETDSEGVVNIRHECFGHPGLYVCDGSVIPSNLAVNPSLTITALAERFASLWPNNEQVLSPDNRDRVIRYSK